MVVVFSGLVAGGSGSGSGVGSAFHVGILRICLTFSSRPTSCLGSEGECVVVPLGVGPFELEL